MKDSTFFQVLSMLVNDGEITKDQFFELRELMQRIFKENMEQKEVAE